MSLLRKYTSLAGPEGAHSTFNTSTGDTLATRAEGSNVAVLNK